MSIDSTKELTQISSFKWIYFLPKNSTKLWWVDPLHIFYVYPSWILSANRDIQNYHFTLLVVISSTPLSLVNKLETKYWRGANNSYCFNLDTGQFIYSHSKEQSIKWYTLHFNNLVHAIHIYEIFTKLFMTSS